MKLYQKVMYDRSKKSFTEVRQDLEKDNISTKYPQYYKFVQKSYYKSQKWIDAWALYVRYELNLPTHCNNTNTYIETSLRDKG